jgi:hypothetical protein
MRGEDDTTLLYHACLAGRERRRQAPCARIHQLGGLGVLAWSAQHAVAWQGTQSHLRQGRGVHAMRTGGQRVWRIGFARKRRAAELLERVASVGTWSEDVFVHRGLRLGTPRLRVHAQPKVPDTAVGRLQHVLASAVGQRRHRGRVDLGRPVARRFRWPGCW